MKKYHNIRDDRGRFFKYSKNLPYFASEEFINRLEEYLCKNEKGLTLITGKLNYITEMWDFGVRDYFKNQNKLDFYHNDLFFGTKSQWGNKEFALGQWSQSVRHSAKYLNHKVIFLPKVPYFAISGKGTDWNIPRRYRKFEWTSSTIINIEPINWNSLRFQVVKNKHGKQYEEI